jgi:thiol:disulfide interchange protein DsbA
LFFCVGFIGLSYPAVEAGKDFVETQRPTPIVPGKIEVLEFFFYGCRGCYQMQLDLDAWFETNKDRVLRRRVPVATRSPWESLARFYFRLERKNLITDLHGAVFQAIHEQSISLKGDADQIRWIKEKGFPISSEEFFGDERVVDERIRQSNKLVERYGVTVTPTLVIGGNYLTTGVMIGRSERLPLVLDALVDRALSMQGQGRQ